MCGIVGTIGLPKTTSARDNFFEQALFADTFRGADSTGVFTVNKEGQVNMAKKATWAPDFLSTRAYNDVAVDLSNCHFIVGHNRKATTGKVNNRNAHPFQHGNITLVHNGSLYSTWRSDLGFNTGKAPDVDSEGICMAFDYHGAANVIPKIEGAFALVWYDQSDGTLNICKNDERPFAVGLVKNSPLVLFASEAKMVDWLADRNKIELEKPAYEIESGIINTWTQDMEFSQQKVELAPVWAGNYPNYGYKAPQYSGTSKLPPTTAEKLAEKNGIKVGDKVHFLVDSIRPDGYANAVCMEVWGRALVKNSNIRVHSYAMYKKDYSGNVDYNKTVYEGTVSHIKVNGDILTLQTTVVRRTDKLKTDFDDPFPPQLEDKSNEESNVAVLYLGPQQKLLTYSEMVSACSNGCCVCASPIDEDDYLDMKWLYKEPVCVGCQDLPLTKELTEAEDQCLLG